MSLSLRKNLAKNIFRGLLFLTFVSMIVGYGVLSLFKKGGAGGASVADVDGSAIDYRDFRRRAEAKQGQLILMRYQLARMGVPFDPEMFAMNPTQLALRNCIEDQLLDRVASSLHIHLPEEYVGLKLVDPYFMTQKIADFFPYYFTVSEEINSELLARLLRSKGMNIADFESHIEHDLERQIVQNIAKGAVYAPSFIIREQYVQENAPKKFSVAKITFDAQLKQAKKRPLSADEVKNFFDEQNKKEQRYVVPEKRSGTVWEFLPERYGIAVTDAAMRSYYDSHKGSFVASPTQLKVRRILFKVKEPADMNIVIAKAQAAYEDLKKAPELFAQKVLTLSEDKATAQKGGVVTIAGRGTGEAAFEQAAFSLKADGDISVPFQTKEGIEIVQRVERKPITYKPFEAVRAEIRGKIILQEFKTVFDKDMERLKREAQENPTVVPAFIASKKAKSLGVTATRKDDSSPVVERLFKIKQPKGLSSYQDDAQGFLIQLVDIAKSYTPELSALQGRVAEDLYKSRAEAAVVVAMTEARKKAHTTPFGEVARTSGAALETINWLKGSEKDRIEKLTKQGLPIASMLPLAKVGSVIAHYDGTNAYVIRLDDVGQVSGLNLKAKEGEMAKALGRDAAGTVQNGFIASLTRNATIEIHASALETSGQDRDAETFE